MTRRRFFLLILCALLAACKLNFSSGTGGSIRVGSQNGTLCNPSCSIDTADGVSESYYAIPKAGYEFDYWEGADSFCKDKESATCQVEPFGPLGIPSLDNFELELTAIFSGGIGVWGNADGPEYNPYDGSCCIFKEELVDPLQDNTDAQGEPQVGMASDGSAVAVWIQNANLWANHFNPKDGWVGAISLSEDFAYSPSLAVYPDGSAVVIWAGGYPNQVGVWARHYNPADGWSDIVSLHATRNSPSKTNVAFDAEGNTLAIWEHWEYGVTPLTQQVYNVWASRYIPGSGWGTATMIENNTVDYKAISSSGTYQSHFAPEVAMSSNGDAVVVWTRYESSGLALNVWSNHYTAGVGWSDPKMIENLPEFSSRPQITYGGDGIATVVWQQYTNTRRDRDIYSAQFSNANGWSNSIRLTQPDSSAMLPHIDANAKGDVIAVWVQTIPDNVFSFNGVYASHYHSSTGWTTPVLIHGKRHPSSAGMPHIKINEQGRATTVFAQSLAGGAQMVGISNYSKSSGWQQDFSISENSFSTSSIYRNTEPMIDMNSNSSVLVWLRELGRPAGQASGRITVAAIHRR